MYIQTEDTPNPNTVKFLPDQAVCPEGSVHFDASDDAAASPLAQKLFEIKGVKSVFLGEDFISVTKIDDKDWFVLKPQVLSTILDGLTMGIAFWDESKKATSAQKQANPSYKATGEDAELIKQIEELLETRVRPAVAQDGGDIVFHNFEDGVVYLEMRGACSGCPSSTATLKIGIENMLKYYVPEVTEVRPVMA